MSDAPLEADELASLVGRLTLLNIRCIRLEASLLGEALVPPSRIVAEIAHEITYALNEGFLGGKFESTVTFYDGADAESARVVTTFVVENALSEGPTPSHEVVGAYLAHNAFFMAYPYIREAIQSALTRIGHGSLTLGILSRDQVAPVRLDIALDASQFADPDPEL
jgi:hypothetical protein